MGLSIALGESGQIVGGSNQSTEEAEMETQAKPDSGAGMVLAMRSALRRAVARLIDLEPPEKVAAYRALRAELEAVAADLAVPVARRSAALSAD